MYLWIPAQAIIAALSLQNSFDGKIASKFIFLDNSFKFFLIVSFLATPPAITNVDKELFKTSSLNLCIATFVFFDKILFIVSWNEAAKLYFSLLDEISLSYDERFIRRKKLITNNGIEFLVNLEETLSVNENNFFELENGNLIKVLSKDENLIEITGDNLKQIIWHIGNRHLPCQIEDNRILIQDDAVILDMILILNGNVKKVVEKFIPEGGAYGIGRTHSHKH